MHNKNQKHDRKTQVNMRKVNTMYERHIGDSIRDSSSYSKYKSVDLYFHTYIYN